MRKPPFILACLITGLVLLGIIVVRITQEHAISKTQVDIRKALISPIAKKSQRIIFVSDRTGNQDIYIMNLDTLETINLTNSPGDDMNPQVANDGRHMIFYSNRDGDNEIYQMDLISDQTTQLTFNQLQDYDPAYSNAAHGNFIIFKSTRDDKLGDIFIMDQSGNNQINLTSGRSTTEEWDPSFSVDGDRIIFTVRSDRNHLTDEIYTMNINGTDLRQITNNTVPDWYASVNPVDGTLVYISKEKPGMKDDIFKMNLFNQTRVRLTNLPGNDADPAWDSQGKKIIFINDNDNDYDLYIMDADGSGLKKIEDTPYNELSPIFLPNEK